MMVRSNIMSVPEINKILSEVSDCQITLDKFNDWLSDKQLTNTNNSLSVSDNLTDKQQFQRVPEKKVGVWGLFWLVEGAGVNNTIISV